MPAPHGSTTTPEPPCQKPSTACFWYRSRLQPSSARSIRCASPSTYPARSSAGQPSFSSVCLICPRSEGCTTTVSASIRSPTSGCTFFDRRISSRTGRSVVVSTSPCVGCLESVSRPYRAMVSAMSTSSACRHGVPRVLDERVDDLLGVVPGGPRVPQTQRRHPVGVDVLRRPLQLGERRDGPTAGLGELVVDLQEQRLVALDDEWPIHVRSWSFPGRSDHGESSSPPYAGPDRAGPAALDLLVGQLRDAHAGAGVRADLVGRVVVARHETALDAHRGDDAWLAAPSALT
ncbi:hypothetical protein STANM309S_04288 [Streptomyces tanashiensis]